ncbi:MAG: hypothetical protein R2781_10365 [Flavobacteriaceae bacterium]
MKTAKNSILAFLILILGACSGSDAYQGMWKATNEAGEHLDIEFGENDLFITQESKTEQYQYSQNSINISNGVKTYGITLSDGRSFQIQFPIKGDESKGAMLDSNGRAVFIINRDDYIGYKEVYGL